MDVHKLVPYVITNTLILTNKYRVVSMFVQGSESDYNQNHLTVTTFLRNSKIPARWH
jgi:hypothetical protein